MKASGKFLFLYSPCFVQTLISNSHCQCCYLYVRCDDRHHGSTEHPVTWISVSHFMSQVRRYHVYRMEGIDPNERTPFPDEPRETSVQFSFMSTNPYQGKNMFTDRLIITRTVQKRSAHIYHEDTHYCHSQLKVTKEMCVKANDTFEKDYNQGNVPSSSCLSDFFISVESDDKAIIPFGNPVRAIDTNARPHGRFLAGIEHHASSDKSPRSRVSEALNHSYHL
jgi:hypothetical protein